MNGRYRNEKAPKAATFRAQKSTQPITEGDYVMNTSTSYGLIAIERTEIDGQVIETVNARDLHAFLEIGTSFKDWIARRVADYGFEEGEDFCSFLSKTPNGGRPSKEYALSLDMAKELSMVERNEKGRQARQYFIECERRAKEVQSHPQIPQTMSEALRLAADQADVIEKQKHDLLIAAPKVAFADQVRIAEDAITMAEAAKLIGTGRGRFFTFMRQQKWITRGGEPYQAKIEAGLMDVKVSHWEHPNEGLKQNVTPLVTGKGLVKLQKLWAQEKEHAA